MEELIANLRNEWYTYIKPLFIDDKCSMCNKTEDLELHHIDRFSELLNETLAELNIQKENVNNLTGLDRKCIISFMNNKQLKCGYETLCVKCHNRRHKSLSFDSKIKLNSGVNNKFAKPIYIRNIKYNSDIFYGTRKDAINFMVNNRIAKTKKNSKLIINTYVDSHEIYDNEYIFLSAI